MSSVDTTLFTNKQYFKTEMGSVKERKKKKKLIQKKLNKNLRHVAKILSKYKVLSNKKKGKTSGSSTPSASSNSGNADIENEAVLPSKQFNWQGFVKVRERMFGDLQFIIRENWNQNSAVKLTGGEIQELSLQFEQRALLACMQADIYKSAIINIMTGIREATDNKYLHPQVEKLVANVWRHSQGTKVKTETPIVIPPLELHNPRPKTPNPPQNIPISPPNEIDIPAPATKINTLPPLAKIPAPPPTKIPTPSPPKESFIPPVPRKTPIHPPPMEIPTSPLKNVPIAFPMEFSGSPSFVPSPKRIVDYSSQNSISPRVEMFRNPSPEPPESSSTVVPMDTSLVPNIEKRSDNRTEKTEAEVEDVTSTTNDHDFIEKQEEQGQNEAELDNLMRILEGTDEESRCDLDTRVKQMQNFFLGDSQCPPRASERAKHFTNDLSGKPNPKMWAIERYIFMYRIIATMSRLNATSYKNVRKTFLSLFGTDSDEENEDGFDDYDEFTSNCVRRILPTVARYLMPYYKTHRVCGGSYVFKNLVRRIAQSMVDQNYYPNDEEIMNFVQKFFPTGHKYMDVGDVWCFTLLDD